MDRFQTKVVLVFLLPLLLGVGASLLSASVIHEHLASARAALHAEERLATIEALAAALGEADAALHGLTSNGGPDWGDRYQEARRDAERQLELLRADAENRGLGMAGLDRLQSALARFESEAAVAVVASRPQAGELAAPAAQERLAALQQGEAALAELRPAVDQLRQETRRSLARASSAAAKEWGERALLVVGPLLAGLVALLLGAAVALRVRKAGRAVAEAANALAEGELSRRLVTGKDPEWGEVARAFNAMAERWEARNQINQLFTHMGKLLHASATLDEAHRVVRQLVPPLFPNESGVLYLQGNHGNGFEPAVAWGEGREKVATLGPDDCWALRGVGPYLVKDPTSSIRCKHVDPLMQGESLCLPLLAQGERVGVLSLRAPSAGLADHFTPERRRMVDLVGEYVALATGNLRLREALRNQALRDSLTGLFNRRYLEESFNRELKWARRRHRPVSVIFCDVDHFKRFNDTHGHDGGDILLREQASLILSLFRSEDIACRYGGEEFVILLRDCGLADALRRGEELREATQVMRVQHNGEALGGITLSVGVAVFPDHGETAHDLLRAADQALFRAKGLGRNQVVLASPPTVEVSGGLPEGWVDPAKRSATPLG